MIFLNINMAIAILWLVIHLLSAIDIAHDFKQKYPDIKAPKTNWASRVLSFIKTIIIAVIPLFNLAMCWTYLFKYSELKPKVMDKMYADIIAKEKENVTHLSETSDGQ